MCTCAVHCIRNPYQPYLPSQDEIDEFRRLLDRARKYDKEHGEPDCELAEKKAALKKIADQMGIDIAFIDEQPDAR